MSNTPMVDLPLSEAKGSSRNVQALDWVFMEVKGSPVESTPQSGAPMERYLPETLAFPECETRPVKRKDRQEMSGTREGFWKVLAWSWLLLGICLSMLLFFRPLQGWFKAREAASKCQQATTCKGVPDTKPIETITVGDRVLADHPLGEEDLTLGSEVDQATWRKLVLRATKADGSFAEIVLLRPQSWLEKNLANDRHTVHLDINECGISNSAHVIKVEPCPPITSGPGRVVTGTFCHRVMAVMAIHVEGQDQPIQTTANHAFWSANRHQFVRADALLPGERLKGLYGLLQVKEVIPHSRTEFVYNLEIHGAHVYNVGVQGILVHNSNEAVLTKLKAVVGDGVSIHHIAIPATGRIPVEDAHGITY